MNEAAITAEPSPAASPAAATGFSVFDSDVFVSIALAVMAALFMGAARWTIGLTLGTAFLPVFVAPIIATYLPHKFSLAATSAWLVAISIATMLPLIGMPSWIQLALLTFTCAAGIQQAAVILFPLRLPAGGEILRAAGGKEEAIARTIVLLLWLAWLTWPIWLAHVWTQPAIAPWLDRLLPFNPIAAIGGVLSDMGDWTHQPAAYTYLLNLGQDVPYAPPASAWPAVCAHGAAVIALIAFRRLAKNA